MARRVLAGHEDAFDELFGANFQGLYRFVLTRVGHDEDLARELTQATICKGFERLETYRGEAALFSWLCSIGRFEITAHFRRQRRRPPQVELAEETLAARGALGSLAFDLGDPEDVALRRELARLVHVTIDNLPRHYRQVLRWKYLDGVPVKDIATRLGVSPKAAESLLTRARETFRDGFAALQAAAPARPGEAT